MSQRCLFCVLSVVAVMGTRASSSEAEWRPVVLVPGEPVVRDSETGLTWQGCVAGRSGDACDSGGPMFLEWQAALAYCADLDWGGYSDWRLPDRNELQSIVDYERYSPSIDATAFPQTPYAFWSSSSGAAASSSAWYVTFDNGNVLTIDKDGTYHARCVRGRVGP